MLRSNPWQISINCILGGQTTMNKFSVPYANDNNTFISYNTFSKYFLFLLKCQTTDLVTMTYDGKQKIQMSFVLLY